MYTFGYWNLRGLGEVIRLLLEYLEVEYKEELYVEAEEWFDKAKKELKSNFPNLPYLIDGDFIVTESLVIPTYLIKKEKKYELLGLNPDGSYNQNEIVVQQLLHVLKDLNDTVYVTTKTPAFKQEKETLFAEKYNPILDKLKKQLGDKDFLIGTLTYADFYLYDLLRYLKYVKPDLNYFPEFMERFENIPQIRKYLDTKENRIYVLDRMKHLFYL